MLANTQVGPQILADGSQPIARSGRSGEVNTADAHARFYEPTYRGLIFRGGMTTTSISNATFTTATTGATMTPIAGIWNPANTNVNCVILQIGICATVTNATNTGPGGFAYMSSLLNTAISTGNAPFNCKTGAATGSVAKDMSGVALTGLTTTLVVRMGAGVAGGSVHNFSFVETAVGTTASQVVSIENFDGGLFVPPGGVWALACTTTPVAHSASSFIVWEEVPL